MSLRLRLVTSIVLVLAVSLSLGALLAGWRAERSIRTELQASMEVGRQTLRNGIADIAGAPDPRAELLRLVATFDGNRHVRAILPGTPGRVASQPRVPEVPVPGWFLWLVAPKLEPVRTALPASLGGGSLLLEAVPVNEAGEVWASFGDSSLVLAVFCLLASLAILLVLRQALRPLARISEAFGRIGGGDYAVRVPARGPRELAHLADGLNRMAGRLVAMEEQTRRLHEQLLTLQDEERADLARDLHDEVGPFLFAVNVSAANIGQLAAAARTEEIPEQVHAIREAIVHVQKHVKAILARLRPIRAVEFGLGPAVAALLAFWRGRHPAIAFSMEIDAAAEACGEAVEEVVYRVVQEGLSNALRHGRPRQVRVLIGCEGDDVLVRVTDDGDTLGLPAKIGFGLAGMRERVAALGGTLATGPRSPAGGWEVTARLPVVPASVAIGADQE